jgi:3-oxoadipate enol-lactonase
VAAGKRRVTAPTSAGWTRDADASLRYEVLGDGPRSVILIHELSGTLDSWDYVIPKLAPGFRILRYDQRGAGLSEKVRAPFTLDQFVSDLERVIAAAELPPPYCVVGIASGAAIAVGFALRRKNDVEALALCAPALQANPERRSYLLERSERAAREGMRAVVDVVFEHSYPEEVIRDRRIYDEYRSRFLAIDPVCYANANKLLADVALESSLSRLGCRCLLVAGRHDRLRPPAYVRGLLGRLRRAEIEEIDSGHIMVLQAPEVIAEKLSHFFRKS